MAEEKKKGEIVKDKYSSMKTKDLLTIIEKHEGSSESATKFQESLSVKQRAAVGSIEDIKEKYLIEIHGEDKRHKGRADNRTIDSVKKAEQLLYAVALEGIRQKHGDDGVKLYKGKPEQIATYLRTKGIDFYELSQQIADNPNDWENIKLVQELGGRLAHVDELEEKLHVDSKLKTHSEHYQGIVEYANSHLRKVKKELRNGLKQENALEHAVQAMAGAVTEGYAYKNKSHLKKYDPDKKK